MAKKKGTTKQTISTKVPKISTNIPKTETAGEKPNIPIRPPRVKAELARGENVVLTVRPPR